MISPAFKQLAQENGLMVASGVAYGSLNGCYVTLSGGTGYQRISIYVGPQEQPAPGYPESQTVSCARQIIHMISTASGPSNCYGLLTGDDSAPALVLNHAGSVVTVSFADTEEAAPGVAQFVTVMLPQIAPLTRPQLCICCCEPTEGEGWPVRLSADTVVPMHDPCLEQVLGSLPDAPKARERNSGVPGAALGALVGAVLFVLLYNLGVAARIAGLLIGLLASWGYDLFKGKPGRAKLAPVIVCSLIAVLLATFAGSVLPFLQKYQTLGASTKAMFAELSGGMPVWFTYVRASIASAGGAFWLGFGLDLLIGLLFTGAGCLDLLRTDASATADAAKPRRLKGKA